MTSKKHVNTSNARSGDQKRELERIAKGDFCPFCDLGYMRERHPHKLHMVGKYWWRTGVKWKYENTSAHFMFVHRAHISSIEELSDAAWKELRKLFTQFMKQNKITGATFLIRTGDTRKTGGSVTHLHAQLVSGGKKKPVVTRIG